jgi:hypothetical protein
MPDDGPAADLAVSPLADLRRVLEEQQVAIADRLEAVRQAEAALAHLHDVLAVPFLPLPGLTGRVTGDPGLPVLADPKDVACHPRPGWRQARQDAGTGREASSTGRPVRARPRAYVAPAEGMRGVRRGVRAQGAVWALAAAVRGLHPASTGSAEGCVR